MNRGGRRDSGSGGGRSALDAAEFRRLIDDTRRMRDLSAVVSRRTKLKKADKGELVGLCIFHQERTPSLHVNDATGLFHCFGCGASGDIFRFVMKAEGLTFVEALRWLGAADLPVADPAARQKAAEEDEADRRAAISDARKMWAACGPVEGTPAEVYLRQVRAITMPLPNTVRFGRVPTGRDEQGNWKRPYPALVCLCTDATGEIIGLQRVFLRDDGLGKRWGKGSKLSLGRPSGGAFKIGADAAEVVICEGPEDGLSLAQGLGDVPVWVAVGTAFMPKIAFPPIVRTVTIAGQNDGAGRLAVSNAALSITERGLAVRTMFPDPRFKDWNDALRGIEA